MLTIPKRKTWQWTLDRNLVWNHEWKPPHSLLQDATVQTFQYKTVIQAYEILPTIILGQGLKSNFCKVSIFNEKLNSAYITKFALFWFYLSSERDRTDRVFDAGSCFLYLVIHNINNNNNNNNKTLYLYSTFHTQNAAQSALNLEHLKQE